MIAPVTFGSLPGDLVDPVNDVTGLLPGGRCSLQRRPVGRLHRTTAARSFGYIQDHHVENALFITGDIHSGWACDLPYDAGTYPLSGSAGVEFVCTSVTSNNLKDITGTPARTTSVAVETDDPGQQPAHQVPQLRRPRLLRARPDRRSGPRWTGSSSATAPTSNTAITYATSYRTLTGTNTVVTRVDRPVA